MDLQKRIEALEKRLRDVEAIEGIRDTIARYCWALDNKDWVEIDAIFTDDAVIDHTKWRGTTFRGKEAILNFCKAHREKAMKFTNRHALNERISVEGNTAKGKAYHLVMYSQPNDSIIGWGHYEWEFRLENGKWRICKMVLLPNTYTTLQKGWPEEAWNRLPTPPPLQ